MTADLFADLSPAAQDRARALLAVSPWAGDLWEVRTLAFGDDLRVTLVCERGFIEFITDSKDGM